MTFEKYTSWGTVSVSVTVKRSTWDFCSRGRCVCPIDTSGSRTPSADLGADINMPEKEKTGHLSRTLPDSCSQAAGRIAFLGKRPLSQYQRCGAGGWCPLPVPPESTLMMLGFITHVYYADKCTVSCQAIEKQLKICGFKRNVDVLILYLAGQGLSSIPSLSQFRRLKYLWISNNKIQDLTFLVRNHCLTELYLNHNELTDISGALKHLRSLQILLLHNNQLKKLVETVKELKGMISLQTLNLFRNPLAQDPDYWLYVIYFLPSVQLLDRKRCEFGNSTNKVPFENPEDAVSQRAMRRSLMEFSSADGSKVPACQERRLENKFKEHHEKLTVHFR
ncbi:PREDICTED: leucine-rich repeat-containing protein 72 [Mesitornis unicolor]|uniref:leucine-rich repeat-containing protein 72 n=1 Tax=Mesitornis unicolor TaxID=54374 RepID=UPI000528BC4A|nr:PREDICTED: leucine-rich repeat-containing protein 72 [Mesitornis unicolor]